jgi:hypothetical protein
VAPTDDKTKSQSEDATPPTTPSPAEPAASSSPILPSIIFAITNAISKEAVIKAFNGEGMTPIIVGSADEIVESITKPEVFLVIIDVEFNNNKGTAFQSQFKNASKAFWIALAKKLTTNQRSALYAAGFADVLNHPVHPVLFKSRSRMLLARFLKTNDFPENVVLPPGMARKTPVAPKGPGANADSSKNQNSSPFKKTEGSPHAQEKNSTHVSGGGDFDQGKDWNIHSSKSETSEDSSVKMIKGEDPNTPDYNHHQSHSQDEGPEWRNKISPSEAAEKGETKFFKKDDPQGAWNNRASQSHEENSDSSTKRFSKDDPQGSWNNHNAASNPLESDNTTKKFTKDGPQGEWNNKNSQTVLAESKPLTTIQSENKTSTDSLKTNSSTEQNSLSQNQKRKEMKIDLSPGSLDLTRDKGPTPQRSSQALGTIRDKVLELKENIEWDPKLWPKDKIPKGSLAEIYGRGFRKCLLELETLFKDTSSLLKSDRITLISLKPEALPKSQYCPEDLYALCSSDGAIKNNDEVPSVFFPQIEIAFERRKPVLLNESVGDPIENKRRPEHWKINGKIESSSAVFPIILEQRPYAVVLIQFADKADDNRIKLIEQAVSFLGLPETHYSQIDFLSRVYRSQMPQ